MVTLIVFFGKDHIDSFTSNFCDQSPCTPNPQPKDEELSFEELERLLAKDLQSYFMKIQIAIAKEKRSNELMVKWKFREHCC
ncbi:hypothetical protein Tco_0797348 [Tanacetum coccineum]